jgi:O-antigen/teichoic acid export membrane protein
LSLTDKVIKNTYYYLISQLIGILSPLVLTPYIISKIGKEEFGIYVIVLGFVGTFNLFDFSVSTSFIKFISEHFHKKEFVKLNNVINTGFLFYTFFSLIFFITGFIFVKPILSLVNISPSYLETSIYIFKVNLVAFFIATSATIFVSVLISLQKMYLTSISGIVISIINFVLVVILLNFGYGLKGLLWSYLLTIILSTAVNIIIVKKVLPELKLSLKYFNRESLKKMGSFGLQMQVSRMASFFSEKYDQFLLGYFTSMNNVTYFDVSGRLSRYGRFLPFQLFQQVAPVAAELNAKEEKAKLQQLYNDTTKYLTIVSMPIFVYMCIFADLLIFTWLGNGFDISVYILRILCISQLVNLAVSAPGNAIIPNLGFPKYLMKEGLINLGINIVLSFILIKYYGVLGAAIGSSIAIIVSSMYIYYTSSTFFKENIFMFSLVSYIKPFTASVAGVVPPLLIYYFVIGNYFTNINRASGFAWIIFTALIFFLIFIFTIIKMRYFNDRDKELFKKILYRIFPLKIFSK